MHAQVRGAGACLPDSPPLSTHFALPSPAADLGGIHLSYNAHLPYDAHLSYNEQLPRTARDTRPVAQLQQIESKRALVRERRYACARTHGARTAHATTCAW